MPRQERRRPARSECVRRCSRAGVRMLRARCARERRDASRTKRPDVVVGHSAAAHSRRARCDRGGASPAQATCDERGRDWEHEIIEFPVVALNLRTLQAEHEFHSYVKPTVNETLTPFCVKLTGISQDHVDAAPTLDQVLLSFDAWLSDKGLVNTDERRAFAFGCDGHFDLQFFVDGETVRKQIPKPVYFDKWVNIKTLFSDHYKERAATAHTARTPTAPTPTAPPRISPLTSPPSAHLPMHAHHSQTPLPMQPLPKHTSFLRTSPMLPAPTHAAPTRVDSPARCAASRSPRCSRCKG